MTTVFVCADDPKPLSTEVSPAAVIEVEGLCASPNQVAPLVPDDETGLVFMIHRSQANLGSIQAVVRRLGFDPLGVGVVDLESVFTGDQAYLACEAAIARVGRYPGSVPEQAKLMASDRRTRRSFLTLGAPVYVGAPRISQADCVAADGCRACVSQCPPDALQWSEGSVVYDVNACVACGICVTTCPVGAISNPAVDPGVVEAEISAVIELSDDPIAIRFRCRESTVSGETGWHLVEVPCTGMLTLGWLLTPLLLGASDVDAVSCSDGGCDLGNSDRLFAAMSDLDRVRGELPDEFETLSRQGNQRTGTRWLCNGSTSRVLAELSSGLGDFFLSFEVADVGLVSIDPLTCTACEMCAHVCPTAALDSKVDDTGVTISFDPRACVACGQCVATCPELANGAIALRRRFDSAEWILGRRDVRREPTPTCEICGQPVAPAAMLARITEVLGDDAAETIDLIRRRCIDCRGR